MVDGDEDEEMGDGADDFVKGIYVNFSMPRCTQMTVGERWGQRESDQTKCPVR